jgi:hypothetical protein
MSSPVKGSLGSSTNVETVRFLFSSKQGIDCSRGHGFGEEGNLLNNLFMINRGKQKCKKNYSFYFQMFVVFDFYNNFDHLFY